MIRYFTISFSFSPLPEEFSLLEEDGQLHYDTLQDAHSSVFVNPAGVHVLLEFFCHLSHQSSVVPTGKRYFHHMSSDEIRVIYPPYIPARYLPGTYYRYDPDPGILDADTSYVIQFPQWSSLYGKNQATSIEVLAVQRQQDALATNESVKSAQNNGRVKTVTFNSPALQAFIALLREHSYERFLQLLSRAHIFSNLFAQHGSFCLKRITSGNLIRRMKE